MTLDPSQILLTDRVAVVTGAAQGIGEAIAIAFARFGAHVAVCDRKVPELDATADAIEAEGRRVVAGELDVRDTDAVREFMALVGEQFGRVDILVNNAGGTFVTSFLEVNEKGQDMVIRENFTSVTNFVRTTVPLMTDGGSIVNITSIEAHRAGPNYAIYSAMKAGVFSLTKTLALELGDRMIRVNCVAPDVIPTPGISEMSSGSMGIHTPLPIEGHADDVAAATVYLASDLSRFVTGTTVHVDGGNSAAAGWIGSGDGRWRTS